MSVVHSHALKYSNQEMDSDIADPRPQQHCHHQHNSGLMRYRSAPSSILTSLVDTINHGCSVNQEDHQHYLPSKSSEMETMLAKLISPNNSSVLSSEPLCGFGGRSAKKEGAINVSQGPQHSFVSHEAQIIYQPYHEQIQALPNGSLGSMNVFDGSFSALNSMASENSTQTKMASGSCSHLIRQKSSPAGFFSNYSVDNAFRVCDVSNGQATTSTSSGLHGTLNFSAKPSSCSMRMPQIVESGNEGMEPNCVENRKLGDDNGSNKCYMQSFTSDFWDGSASNASKTASNNREIMFSTSNNAFEAQDADFGYKKFGLTHHLSLPSSSTKVAGMDKLFQVQGSVPCKIRAKRGFATHPRSIAERERRTRISARIKKLQDLFPKLDKQTSTADMLDLAVEYIKDLQKQVKILKDTRAKCTCSSNQKQ